jgi:uncharacterized membrane protein YhiD involved in acid resistance
MGKVQSFQEFLTTQSVHVSLVDFIINLLLTAVLALILSAVFRKYSTIISNRRSFANNFVLIATTTMLIIAIVKSSLALSLGLVGALSIVRFRAAIKEPEELAYLFLTIAIGLGMGADQRMATVVAFLFIMMIIIIRSLTNKKVENRNLYFNISGPHTEKIDIEKVVEILIKYCGSVNLQRLDENQEKADLSFLVEFSDHVALNACKVELQEIYQSASISFLDYKGLYAN